MKMTGTYCICRVPLLLQLPLLLLLLPLLVPLRQQQLPLFLGAGAHFGNFTPQLCFSSGTASQVRLHCTQFTSDLLQLLHGILFLILRHLHRFETTSPRSVKLGHSRHTTSVRNPQLAQLLSGAGKQRNASVQLCLLCLTLRPGLVTTFTCEGAGDTQER